MSCSGFPLTCLITIALFAAWGIWETGRNAESGARLDLAKLVVLSLLIVSLYACFAC